MTSEDQSKQDIDNATEAVRHFAGSDAYRTLIVLLDVLSASYCLDLMTIKPDQLVRVQTALRQVRALRDVLDGSLYAEARI